MNKPEEVDVGLSELGTGVYVTELGPYDVLLGRGTGPSSNEGNVNFRQKVEDMKSAYTSTPSRKAKNKLVRKTVESIKAQNGRFLNKLSKGEKKLLGHPLSTHTTVYEVVQDSVAFEKTKQAIRYVHYKKDPTTAATKKRPAASNASSGQSGSGSEGSDDNDNDSGKSTGAGTSSSSHKKRRAEPQTRREYSIAAGRTTWNDTAGGGDGGNGALRLDGNSSTSDRSDALLLASLPAHLSGPIGHQISPAAFAPGTAAATAAASAGNNAFLHGDLLNSLAPHSSSSGLLSAQSIGAFSSSLGSANSASPLPGGFPFLGFQPLPMPPPPTTLQQHRGLGGSGLLLQQQTGSAAALSSASSPAAPPPSSSTTASNIYNRLLSHQPSIGLQGGGGSTSSLMMAFDSNNGDIPPIAAAAGGGSSSPPNAASLVAQFGGAPAPAAASSSSTTAAATSSNNSTSSNPIDALQHGLPTGLFQQALENDQLRSILLSDDRYRPVIESMLLQQRDNNNSNPN